MTLFLLMLALVASGGAIALSRRPGTPQLPAPTPAAPPPLLVQGERYAVQLHSNQPVGDPAPTADYALSVLASQGFTPLTFARGSLPLPGTSGEEDESEEELYSGLPSLKSMKRTRARVAAYWARRSKHEFPQEPEGSGESADEERERLTTLSPAIGSFLDDIPVVRDVAHAITKVTGDIVDDDTFKMLTSPIQDLVVGPLRDFANTVPGRWLFRAMAASFVGPLQGIFGPQLGTVAWGFPGLIRGERFDQAWLTEFERVCKETAQYFGAKFPAEADQILKEIATQVPSVVKFVDANYPELEKFKHMLDTESVQETLTRINGISKALNIRPDQTADALTLISRSDAMLSWQKSLVGDLLTGAVALSPDELPAAIRAVQSRGVEFQIATPGHTSSSAPGQSSKTMLSKATQWREVEAVAPKGNVQAQLATLRFDAQGNFIRQTPVAPTAPVAVKATAPVTATPMKVSMVAPPVTMVAPEPAIKLLNPLEFRGQPATARYAMAATWTGTGPVPSIQDPYFTVDSVQVLPKV